MRHLAREMICAADGIGEGVATLDGLMHMINAWERDARPPSEMYWLIYVRLFPGLANGTGPALRRASELPGPAEIDALEAAALSAQDGGLQAEIRGMAEELRIVQKQVTEISRRLARLAGAPDDDGEPS